MNEIEQIFYNTYESFCYELGVNYDDLISEKIIGIYKVDFLYSEKFVIEIDGHEAHKSKEQREKDYKRERYLMKLGYVVIRFTGTEVFLEPDRCIQEMIDIVNNFNEISLNLKEEWFKLGEQSAQERGEH